ncbi:MAG: DUF2256 domain-containing protein [Candidatus Limnocylindrales bacterium]
MVRSRAGPGKRLGRVSRVRAMAGVGPRCVPGPGSMPGTGPGPGSMPGTGPGPGSMPGRPTARFQGQGHGWGRRSGRGPRGHPPAVCAMLWQGLGVMKHSRKPAVPPDQLLRGRHRPPSERPTRDCVTCGRPFAWRRRWATTWNQVRYCSERCRRRRA